MSLLWIFAVHFAAVWRFWLQFFVHVGGLPLTSDRGPGLRQSPSSPSLCVGSGGTAWVRHGWTWACTAQPCFAMWLRDGSWGVSTNPWFSGWSLVKPAVKDQKLFSTVGSCLVTWDLLRIWRKLPHLIKILKGKRNHTDNKLRKTPGYASIFSMSPVQLIGHMSWG